MKEVFVLLSENSFFKILTITVLLDTFLGTLRALKFHKFNSCIGIDGIIRKVAMLISVGFSMLIDTIMQFNLLFMIPEKYMQYIGITKLGLCEYFCLLFFLYETVSVLKNMTLCGLPIPNKIKAFIQRFLDEMTDELSKDTKEG